MGIGIRVRTRRLSWGEVVKLPCPRRSQLIGQQQADYRPADEYAVLNSCLLQSSTDHSRLSPEITVSISV